MLSQQTPYVTLAPQLEIAVEDRGTTRTVTPRGEIDVASSHALRHALDAALAGGLETIVLDFAETTFMDTTGVHLVLDAEARARHERVRLILLPGSPAVRRVLEVTGVQTPGEAARPSARS